MGWDQHENLPTQIKGQASDVDQPTAALIMDLKQRGLLEDTLVVWGGEFGRTSYGAIINFFKRKRFQSNKKWKIW